MDELTLDLSVAEVWASIRETRERIDHLLARHPLELRFATKMAGSELLENAAKYGAPVAGAPCISFCLTVRGDSIELITKNGCKDLEDVDRLQTIVTQISNTHDPQTLYLQMIAEAALRPTSNQGSGLGLYRIAAEGRFVLSCHYDGEIVRMLAYRSHP